MENDFRMSWAEIKSKIEALGITDETFIAYIDITELHYKNSDFHKIPQGDKDNYFAIVSEE